jgi:hypothetical protein
MRTLVILALVACGGPARRASVPDRLEPLPVDSFYSTYVAIHDGGRAPIAVARLQARCVDESMCTTIVKLPDADHPWPELQIIARRPGKTSVITEYAHPTRSEWHVDEIAVELTAAPSYAMLAVGEPIPRSPEDAVVHHVRVSDLSLVPATGDDSYVPVGRCQRAASAPVTGTSRPDIQVFDCSLVVEVARDTYRFRRCAGACPALREERYTVCARVIDGTVTAVRVLERRSRPPHTLDEKLTIGAFPDGACRGDATR